MNLISKFLAKAKEVAPAAHADLDSVLDRYKISEEFSADAIDEVVFRESEYMGGMAVVILNLIK